MLREWREQSMSDDIKSSLFAGAFFRLLICPPVHAIGHLTPHSIYDSRHISSVHCDFGSSTILDRPFIREFYKTFVTLIHYNLFTSRGKINRSFLDEKFSIFLEWIVHTAYVGSLWNFAFCRPLGIKFSRRSCIGETKRDKILNSLLTLGIL